jgi:hypothetical protein
LLQFVTIYHALGNLANAVQIENDGVTPPPTPPTPPRFGWKRRKRRIFLFLKRNKIGWGIFGAKATNAEDVVVLATS